MSIYKKLLVIQKELKGLAKDKKSNNYDYVTGNKLLDHLKPIMNSQGLILKQEVTKVETERNDYELKSGAKKSEILYKVWQKFTWIDTDTGDKDVNEFFSAGQNDWEKGLGSALTYAERYFLLKYFHIATDEDDIDNADRKANEEKEEKERLEKEEKERLVLLEKQKSEEIALKGKIVKEINDFLESTLKEDEDLLEKQERLLKHINHVLKKENKVITEFSLKELEAYKNKYLKESK